MLLLPSRIPFTTTTPLAIKATSAVLLLALLVSSRLRRPSTKFCSVISGSAFTFTLPPTKAAGQSFQFLKIMDLPGAFKTCTRWNAVEKDHYHNPRLSRVPTMRLACSRGNSVWYVDQRSSNLHASLPYSAQIIIISVRVVLLVARIVIVLVEFYVAATTMTIYRLLVYYSAWFLALDKSFADPLSLTNSNYPDLAIDESTSVDTFYAYSQEFLMNPVWQPDIDSNDQHPFAFKEYDNPPRIPSIRYHTITSTSGSEQPPPPASEQVQNDKSAKINRRCQWAGCGETQRFPQDSAFKKHMDKHERPHKCTVPHCKATDFTNLGDLKRHHRTVHRQGSFFCPSLSCKRHVKGFGRKDNRDEHVKRVHSAGMMMSSSPEGQDMEDHGSNGGREGSGTRVVERADYDMEVDVSIGTNSFAESKIGLARKLQELKDAKAAAIAEVAAKFDKDIDAMERVMCIE
ncbi:hypothetical protein VTL71DRAFT_16203 [Oculimacula yallundae]|uniref:C2H2-type domain-containing protein n=1 Tax=Oculimacula yallundae TaxID=86028 RepID=A0ABR4CDT8_9HELO